MSTILGWIFGLVCVYYSYRIGKIEGVKEGYELGKSHNDLRSSRSEANAKREVL